MNNFIYSEPITCARDSIGGNQMNSNDKHVIRGLFDDYLRMLATSR